MTSLEVVPVHPGPRVTRARVYALTETPRDVPRPAHAPQARASTSNRTLRAEAFRPVEVAARMTRARVCVQVGAA